MWYQRVVETTITFKTDSQVELRPSKKLRRDELETDDEPGHFRRVRLRCWDVGHLRNVQGPMAPRGYYQQDQDPTLRQTLSVPNDSRYTALPPTLSGSNSGVDDSNWNPHRILEGWGIDYEREIGMTSGPKFPQARYAIHGMSGVGKAQLVLMFARSLKDTYGLDQSSSSFLLLQDLQKSLTS